MKKQYALLVILSLCYSASVFAQNKTLTLGLFYLPVCGDHLGHVSLSYYQSLKAKHALGIKTMFTSDVLGKTAGDTRYDLVNTDLVHSWRKRSNTDRSTWRLDAGFSMLATITHIPPNDMEAICITGMSEEDLFAQEVYNSKSHTQTSFKPGIATAASWEFAITRHLGLGIGLTLNLYFSEKETPELLPMPNLNAAYSFR